MGESRIQEAESDVHSLTIIPPIMGLTSKQPLSNMDPAYSPDLLNFFPNGSTVDLRKGFTIHSTAGGFPDTKSIFEYVQEDGTRFLLSFNSNEAYNCTAAGAAVSISSTVGNIGTTEAYGVNFGNRFYFKLNNNTTDVYYWNGTGDIQLAGFTGPGGDDKALINITSYKGRLYFVEYNAASIWYASGGSNDGIGNLTGTLTELDLTSIFRLGGSIYFIGSTSIGGNTIQEAFVIISEQGEVLIYGGDGPNATSWGLIGKYEIPAPVSRKAFFYWGQDIVIITRQGVIALSEVIAAGPRGQYLYLSDEINSLFQADIANTLLGSFPYAITGIVYPKGNYLLINLPGTSSPSTSYQYVMNLQTRAWTKFSNQYGLCWSLFNNDLYFGGEDGATFKADNGYFDESIDSPGTALTRNIRLKHAYNYFGDPEHTKSFVSAIPTIYQSEGLNLTIDADLDFSDTTAVSTVTDTADTSYKLYRPICGLKGIGTACSIRIDGTVTTKRISLQATKVVFKTGNISK